MGGGEKSAVGLEVGRKRYEDSGWQGKDEYEQAAVLELLVEKPFSGNLNQWVYWGELDLDNLVRSGFLLCEVYLWRNDVMSATYIPEGEHPISYRTAAIYVDPLSHSLLCPEFQTSNAPRI